MMEDNHTTVSDHDLLIEVRSWMKIMLGDIKEIKSSLAHKLDKDEAARLNQEATNIHDDHENRLRLVEKISIETRTWGFAIMIAIGILEFLINKFL